MAPRIPPSEIHFRATRAGGPGGQHVNTSATRVEAIWDVASSPSLTDDERRRVLTRLANRIGRDGLLRVAADERRSQLQNKDAAVERLNALVAAALKVQRPRKRTRPPAHARAERLRRKRRRAETKRGRSRVRDDD